MEQLIDIIPKRQFNSEDFYRVTTPILNTVKSINLNYKLRVKAVIKDFVEHYEPVNFNYVTDSLINKTESEIKEYLSDFDYFRTCIAEAVLEIN